jgi:hypothetical protein
MEYNAKRRKGRPDAKRKAAAGRAGLSQAPVAQVAACSRGFSFS